ncbi:non-ribosomal peptide synthetase [Xanthomonas arboricola]|uniref:non-ribosomal peptide synthetase n=1 Tax=Xanthomonas arboricola TaxID=56448 RepID=UPI001187E28F|nr:non-ribosomal peptide synthetase [Xanthomonas arboricola]QDS16118.1 amino acid adenylation domain-containing protein [Xanthomonas arboricola]
MSNITIQGFTCSPQQSLLWSSLRRPDAKAYVQGVVRIAGYDEGRVQAAFAQLERRHESLRTRFALLPGMRDPLQVIVEDGGAWSDGADLRDHADAAARLQELCREEAGKPFDFEHGPLLRAACVRSGEDALTLVVTASPLVVDRGSIVRIAGELATILAGTADAGEDGYQYADYASWRNSLLESEEHAAARSFWEAAAAYQESHGGDQAPVDTGQVSVAFDASVAQRLAGIAQTSGASLSEALLCAWLTYCGRLDGASSARVESSFDGRTHAELERAIGPFEQRLPVDLEWRDSDVFGEALRKLMGVVDGIRAHQDYAGPDVGAGNAHAVRGFDFLDLGTGAAAGRVQVAHVARQGAPRKLSLQVERSAAGEYALVLQFDRGRWSVEEAQRIADGLTAYLADIAQQPDLALDRLRIVTEGEKTRLLEFFNQTATVYPGSELFHRLFEQQARDTPHNTAVVYGRDSLSYAELDARAERLAQALCAQDGVAAGKDHVAVLLRRTPELLVAVLGVMKAGRAYVPLDPEHPTPRFQALLADLSLPPVITEAALAERVPPGVAVLRIDQLDATGSQPQTPPQAETANEDGERVAYVLFTSGSTGRPKGVAIPHRALSNYVKWSAATYGLASGQGALVHTSIAFDLTITSLLAPLTVGQRVVLLPEDDGVAALARALQPGSDYSLVKITPSHLKTLRGLMAPGTLDNSIRVLVIGGEALEAAMLEDIRSHAPTMRVFNEYGPTEATVGCSAWELGPADQHGAVPIGHPIANTALYVLDRHGQPVPIGTPGELHVGGKGIAIGYTGADQLEGFRANPWGPGLSYKTGDFVRRREDGALVFLGRVDEEIKVNGVRIQPSEIEAALSQHPAVAEAFVVAYTNAGGERRLVAYIVARPGQSVHPQALRDWLAQRLPIAMTPSSFITVAAIPVNRNGKRDASALPPPENAVMTLAPYVEPRNEEERVLQNIFARIFESERIGIDDNYFVLGGDSLRSVQVSALAQKMGLMVSVAQIHRSPTIRELAAKVRVGDPLLESAPNTVPFSLISAQDRAAMSDDIEDAYPLNLLQEGMIYHREFAAKSAVYHAMCSYRIRAPFDLDLMRKVIQELVERHPLLRTSFDLSTYSRPLQLIHKTFELPFRFDDLRGQSPQSQDETVDQWMEQEKQTGFDLDGYPLIRYQVHLLEDGVFQLGYSFHHEIIDGWSDAFMVTELLTHYLSTVFGQPYEAPLPTTTFREAIALEQVALKTERFREFWLKYLDDAQLMNLPRLIGRLKADKGARKIIKFEIPISQQLSDSVKALAEKFGVPLKTLLLAVHLRVMSVFGGGKDVLSYTVGNGRPENSEGHGVIGLFVNSLAFRLPMPGGTWEELAQSVLKREQELLPYRRYPMAELKRQAGNEPLSETLFFYNHYHVADVLQRWSDAELLGLKVYGESTFPYCINAYLAPVTKLLGMRVEYDSLQYTAELMEVIGQCYLSVLDSMVAAPNGRYDEDPFISDADLRKLTHDWSATPEVPTDCQGIHRLIEAVARATPDRVAVTQGEEHLSYGALNRKANQLARHLRESGVRPGDLVPLCLNRSVWMPVAILGVLKAGAAYVPIDPSNPKDRIELALQDIASAIVVTTSDLVEIAGLGGARPLLLDRESEALDALPGHNLALPDMGDRPAYVIYTSGSTGRPKGVQIPHRALINSTLARREFYLERVENFLLLSSYAFDSSVAGIFWTLVDGGRLVLQPESAGVDLTTVEDAVLDEQITHTLSIPSLYDALLQQHRDLGPLALKTVIMAGEACPAELYECHSRTLPKVAFFNEYGPTEATVWSTVSRGEATPLCPSVLIGKPVPGTQVLVLDAFGFPVPVGVAGELHIAGTGLADGYVQGQALTAERFVPNPYAATPGGRMYRSGDLVRWMADGRLDFLGRMDGQVKINGFRVETSEIESVLGKHPDVHRAVVQVRSEKDGAKRLVAYILADTRDEPALINELSQLARDKLPKYMLPAQYVRLETLPTTVSGKLDLKSLPEPPKERVGNVEIRLPRTTTEEVLAGIWSEVLGVPVVGIDQHFYELGGESLRAMRIMARMRSAFKVQLPINLLMTDDLNVERVAEVIEATLWSQAQQRNASDHVVGSV